MICWVKTNKTRMDFSFSSHRNTLPCSSEWMHLLFLKKSYAMWSLCRSSGTALDLLCKFSPFILLTAVFTSGVWFFLLQDVPPCSCFVPTAPEEGLWRSAQFPPRKCLRSSCPAPGRRRRKKRMRTTVPPTTPTATVFTTINICTRWWIPRCFLSASLHFDPKCSLHLCRCQR